MNIKYRELHAHECERMKEINPARFIKRAWRSVDGVKKWVDLNWLDKDYPEGYDVHLAALHATFAGGGFAIGAFAGERLVGFCSVNRAVFGSRHRYVSLDQLYVDNMYQGQGVGKKLFFLSAKKARLWDVCKLYICAGSSEDTLAFYKSLGCVEALEVNQQLFESDVNDMQLEYRLI